MADTTYVQRLAAAMGVPEERAKWSADDKARVRALASRLDVSPQAIDKYFRDGSKAMSAPNNSRTARYLKVDPDWLATGEGEMRSAAATAANWPMK